LRPEVERFASVFRWTSACALIALWACGAAAVDKDCEALVAIEHDGCVHARVQRASTATEVLELAPTIHDALVRDAALLQWVNAHRKSLPQRDGQAICALLSPREQNACSRRLNAPHLSR
jgi:hypothetical protein